MNLPALVNPGVRAAFSWVCIVILFGALVVNRVNLSGDSAYQWIDQQKYSDVQGVNTVQQLNHWDAVWFTNLSARGYDYSGPDAMSNVVFFPLYPLAVRLGTELFQSQPAYSGVALSIFFTLLSCGLLYAVAKSYSTEEKLLLPIYALLAFPTAIFLIAPYSESLFLFLSLSFFWALQKKKYVLALLLGVLATLTRSVGLLLIIFGVANALQYWKLEKRWKLLLPILLPVGTFAFLLYEKIRFGSYFVYFHVESAWGRAFSVNWDHLWFGSAASRAQFFIDVGLLLFVLACSAYLIRKRLYAFGLYSMLLVLLPVSTGTLMSVGRYALAAFPIFFIPALFRSQLVRTTWYFCSVLLFGMTAMLFLQGHWAG